MSGGGSGGGGSNFGPSGNSGQGSHGANPSGGSKGSNVSNGSGANTVIATGGDPAATSRANKPSVATNPQGFAGKAALDAQRQRNATERDALLTGKQSKFSKPR